ncbi:MAG: TIGR04282 family arsenosugar biosynthesis glycosyltransferase [Desulfuromonadaceae bacterium]
MQNTIIVFTKVPKSGETKTRLMTDREGILTPDEAMALYEGCLLDVINVCIAAKSGDVRICYNNGGDVEYLEELLKKVSDRSQIKELYSDKGGNFDECMQYAADYILKDGGPDRLADSLLIVGGDIPTLQPYILQDAVKKMEKLACSKAGLAAAIKLVTIDQQIGAALVEGACQEGGFSIIGYTCATPFVYKSVFYNQDGITALDMLLLKAVENNIPLAVVEAVPDVDIPVDLASMIPVVKALRLASYHDERILTPVNTLKILEEIGLESTATPPQR